MKWSEPVRQHEASSREENVQTKPGFQLILALQESDSFLLVLLLIPAEKTDIHYNPIC